MKIQIVSIGNELLLGSTVNTNSTYICSCLLNAGYQVHKTKEISDDPKVIHEELTAALEESDLVITTGGLGPTFDDLTRKVVCEVFDTTLVLFPEILEDLNQRFPTLDCKENQAMQPKGAVLLKNPSGTAPGVFLEKKSHSLLMLPGVPNQMKEILSGEGINLIRQKFPIKEQKIVKEYQIGLLIENDVNPLLTRLHDSFPKVQLGVYPNYGHLTIRVVAPDSEIADVNGIDTEIKNHFQDHILEFSKDSLEMIFHRRMIQTKKTFALAESCTGGSFASRLSKIPDASLYFLGSLVTYSNKAKEKFLGVDPKIIATHGAVSAECVKAMAQGVIERLNPDYVAAISGIAGPSGGSQEKPVGTIWTCYGKPGSLITELVPVRKTYPRNIMIEYTINYLMAKLLLSENG